MPIWAGRSRCSAVGTPSSVMANFPIQEAQLISLFMQSTVYGVHVVTFLMCMWALLRPLNSGRPVNWPWLSVAVILFAIGTADVSFNLYHNLIAFIYYTGLGGAQAQFEDLSSWVNVMRVCRSILLCLSVLTGVDDCIDCVDSSSSDGLRRCIGAHNILFCRHGFLDRMFLTGLPLLDHLRPSVVCSPPPSSVVACLHSMCWRGGILYCHSRRYVHHPRHEHAGAIDRCVLYTHARHQSALHWYVVIDLC